LCMIDSVALVLGNIKLFEVFYSVA
jgi:hypothetical protein